MAFCRNCGNQLEAGAGFCPNCGTAQNTVPTPSVTSAPIDNGGFWWGVLGCCVPIAGLILFLVWKDTKPKTSKAAGVGALVSVIVGVVFYVLYFILIGVLAAVSGF